jgi:hypothetical protein
MAVYYHSDWGPALRVDDSVDATIGIHLGEVESAVETGRGL